MISVPLFRSSSFVGVVNRYGIAVAAAATSLQSAEAYLPFASSMLPGEQVGNSGSWAAPRQLAFFGRTAAENGFCIEQLDHMTRK